MVWFTSTDKEDDFDMILPCALPLQIESALADTMLDHLSKLQVASRASIVRLSGIICVLGMSTFEVETIEKLIDAGMNIACFDFAHGSVNYHRELLSNLRCAVNNYNTQIGMKCPLAISVATKGPILRVHIPMEGKGLEITVKKGDIIQITGNEEVFYTEEDVLLISYSDIYNAVAIGSDIIIGKMKIVLRCIRKQNSRLFCEVIKEGDLRSGSHVHLPKVHIQTAGLTDRDKSALQFANEEDIDIIIAAYIQDAASVTEIRNFFTKKSNKVMIISKIENYAGVKNIDEIIKFSDGILIDRVNLGDEVPEEQIFLIQKSIISKCNMHGKPVICASHILNSMTKNHIPSRAERIDLANAILDGADCVMLTKETAFGLHPVECVLFAAKICKQGEAGVWQKALVSDLCKQKTPPIIAVHAIASSVAQISLLLAASAIIVTSSSLTSAQLVTQYRPKCPIIAVTRNIKKARQAHLFRGILPLMFKAEREPNWNDDVESRIYFGVNFGRKKGFIRPGDCVVTLTCSKQGCGFTDKMKICYVSKKLPHGLECTC